MLQRLMTVLLQVMLHKKCLVYLDDVKVFSINANDHVQSLQEIFDRLRRVGLKLNPSKCEFLKRSISYLGHVVSPEGIRTDSSTTERIKWPIRKNPEEVRSFMGLANYYRRFVQGFAHIASPLHRLTEKGRPFNWTADCTTAFTELKSKLSTTPILAYPDFSEGHAPFILDTDASGKAIGGVLYQVQRDGLQCVC